MDSEAELPGLSLAFPVLTRAMMPYHLSGWFDRSQFIYN